MTRTKNNIYRRFLGRAAMVAVMFLMVSTPMTASYYMDTEVSEGNSFSATSLDMTLTSGTVNFNPDILLLGESATRSVSVENVGQLGFDYSVGYEMTGDNPDVCGVLELVVDSGSATGYLPPAGVMNIAYSIALPSGAHSDLQDSGCEFYLRANAWQPELGSIANGFWDTEVLENTVSTGHWYDPEPPQVGAGDVVINEIMWMGSTGPTGSSYDEWIELRNMTGSDIALDGWVIENGGSGSSAITLSGVIAGDGFFLISHYASNASEIADAIVVDNIIPGISLRNDGEQLTLKDVIGNTIDQTPVSGWLPVLNPSLNQSMERNVVPGDGTLAGSWHTCIAAGCNTLTFWDSVGNNYGTPNAANLSENDPTSLMEVLVTPDPSPEPTPPAPQVGGQASPSPTPTPQAEPSATPSPEPSMTPSPSPEPTPSPQSGTGGQASPSPEASTEPVATEVPTEIPNEEV